MYRPQYLSLASPDEPPGIIKRHSTELLLDLVFALAQGDVDVFKERAQTVTLPAQQVD